MDLTEYQEDDERDDDERDHGVDEHAVIESRHAGILCGLQARGVLSREVDEEIVEIDPTEEQPDRRHQDVLDQRVDDGGQRDADDERESQCKHVRLEKEVFELGQHARNLHALRGGGNQHAGCQPSGQEAERYKADRPCCTRERSERCADAALTAAAASWYPC